jgi:hypothetical protein
MNRKFTKFEGALINELAHIANLLVGKLEAEGPEHLSAVALREVIEVTVRVAAAQRRLQRLRRLKSPGRRDTLKLEPEELARLRLGAIDLDSPFGVEDLKP